jgi:RNA polymerase-interacting CarD/CdnL/TRCF family regulator
MITSAAAISPVAHFVFEIGETVVHPRYGVGQIVKLEEREFERGNIRHYYEISIPGGSTVWVPVDARDSGLRKLAGRSDIVDCRKILESRPSPLTADGRFRQSELMAYLKRGTIAAHCEVVRDLSAFVAHKSSYGVVTGFLEAALGVLCQEWALVEGITPSAAVVEISLLLEKSNLTTKETEP